MELRGQNEVFPRRILIGPGKLCLSKQHCGASKKECDCKVNTEHKGSDKQRDLYVMQM